MITFVVTRYPSKILQIFPSPSNDRQETVRTLYSSHDSIQESTTVTILIQSPRSDGLLSHRIVHPMCHLVFLALCQAAPGNELTPSISSFQYNSSPRYFFRVIVGRTFVKRSARFSFPSIFATLIVPDAAASRTL